MMVLQKVSCAFYLPYASVEIFWYFSSFFLGWNGNRFLSVHISSIVYNKNAIKFYLQEP